MPWIINASPNYGPLGGWLYPQEVINIDDVKQAINTLKRGVVQLATNGWSSTHPFLNNNALIGNQMNYTNSAGSVNYFILWRNGRNTNPVITDPTLSTTPGLKYLFDTLFNNARIFGSDQTQLPSRHIDDDGSLLSVPKFVRPSNTTGAPVIVTAVGDVWTTQLDILNSRINTSFSLATPSAVSGSNEDVETLNKLYTSWSGANGEVWDADSITSWTPNSPFELSPGTQLLQYTTEWMQPYPVGLDEYRTPADFLNSLITSSWPPTQSGGTSTTDLNNNNVFVVNVHSMVEKSPVVDETGNSTFQAKPESLWEVFWLNETEQYDASTKNTVSSTTQSFSFINTLKWPSQAFGINAVHINMEAPAVPGGSYKYYVDIPNQSGLWSQHNVVNSLPNEMLNIAIDTNINTYEFTSITDRDNNYTQYYIPIKNVLLYAIPNYIRLEIGIPPITGMINAIFRVAPKPIQSASNSISLKNPNWSMSLPVPDKTVSPSNILWSADTLKFIMNNNVFSTGAGDDDDNDFYSHINFFIPRASLRARRGDASANYPYPTKFPTHISNTI